MKRHLLMVIFLLLFLTPSAFAEYRAYLLEIFDHIVQKKTEQQTGFSPDKYITTHGGGNRLSVFVKATWMCYGDTSKFQSPCPMPAPIEPKFQRGEQVKITLKKHISEGWTGVIELAYYQAGVKSNVYGVRFGEKRQLYNRYFEFDLEKTGPATAALQPVGGENTATQPIAGAQPQIQ